MSQSSYRHNEVIRSSLTGEFYFVKKAEEMGNGICRVVGKKVNITAHLQPYLLKKFKLKPRSKEKP